MEQEMNITISSLLSEDAAGSASISVSPSTIIGDVLRLYCSEKGICASSDYILCNSANKLLDATKSLKNEHVEDGDTLMLSVSDENEESNSFSNWGMVTCLSLFIGSLGLVYVFYIFLAPVLVPEKHGIFIDAGSSHSRLYVYMWSATHHESTENLKIVKECYMNGGISQYRSRTKDLLPYFQTCLDKAKSLVPHHKREETPLILGATAGMRILRQYDPDGANMILSAIRQIFTSETSFKVNENDVFIVSGQREGIDGWTAVNYLFNSFWQADDPEPYLSALDLGGASFQVSTYMDKPGIWPTVNVSLFNTTYSVCSKSFLCYGISKAQYRYEYLLAQGRSNKSSSFVNNPCLPSGSTTIFTKMDVSEPCVLSDKDDIRYLNFSRVGHKERKYVSKYIQEFINEQFQAEGTLLLEIESGNISVTNNHNQFSDKVPMNFSDDNDEALYTMNGVSDSLSCQKLVRELFDFSLCNKTFAFGDCLDNKHVPPYSGEIVGFSSIFFKIFPLLGIDKHTTLHEFEAAVMKTCSTNYTDLRSTYPDLPEVLAEDLCFDVMYVYMLLTEGLAITPQKWKNMLFAKQVKDQDVGWALGLMLNRTSLIPARKEAIGTMDLTPFLALTLLFSACIIISALFLWNALKLKKRNSSYKRVLNEYIDQQRIVNP